MPKTSLLFATRIYEARVSGRAGQRLLADVERASRAIAAADRAGQTWCREHSYAGYTSYASLDDLVWRSPEVAELQSHLDRHVSIFAREVDLDLQGRKLALDSIWINILAPRRYACGPHPSAFRHQRHVLRVGAARGGRHQVRGSASRAHDGGAAAQSYGAAREPYLRHHRAKTWHSAALGELAAPRGPGQSLSQGPNLAELQLRLALERKGPPRGGGPPMFLI